MQPLIKTSFCGRFIRSVGRTSGAVGDVTSSEARFFNHIMELYTVTTNLQSLDGGAGPGLAAVDVVQ
ncbi:hypothetical protein R1flu_015549 [Riccia fluitans]|uniref:Uncharacterized protein n=1 Tax=Riccia fluitans TaxID=41844 RepID=A0ABD1YJP0_9MARC